MQIQDRLIYEIESLPPESVINVYEMVMDLKNYNAPSVKKHDSEGEIPAYLRIQKILKKCSGSLSDDIISARKDRI